MKQINEHKIYSQPDRNNHIYTVGAPVHYSIGSDIYPATVTKITKNKIYIKNNKVKRDYSKSPEFQNQNWIITDWLDGKEKEFTYRPKNKVYIMARQRSIGKLLGLGHRCYYDWTF